MTLTRCIAVAAVVAWASVFAGAPGAVAQAEPAAGSAEPAAGAAEEAAAQTPKPEATKKKRSSKKKASSKRKRSSKKKATSKKKRSSKKKSRSASSKKKKRRGSRSRPGLYSLNTPWHKPPSADVCPELQAAPPGSFALRPVVEKTCHVVHPPDAQGVFSAESLAAAGEGLAEKNTHALHAVHPRLLSLLLRAVRHFDVPYVHVISGYRGGRDASRHHHGLAADVVFPGVTNKQLADFLRLQGFVGVGVYLRTGFIHLDVRERSYFWVDASPPGRRWKGKQVRADEAKAADVRALEAGEVPFVAPPEMQAALERRSSKARRRAAAKKKRKKKAAKKKRASKKKAASKGADEA